MAAAGVNYDDLLKELQGAPKSTGGAGVSVSASSSGGVDLKSLDAIGRSITAVAGAESVKAAGLEQMQTAAADMQSKLLSSAAVQSQVAADAQGRLTEQATTAKLSAQGENTALKDQVDLASQLSMSIKTIAEAADSATMNVMRAKQANNTTLGSVLRGENTFGQWVDTTFVKGAEDYVTDAKADAEVVRLQTTKVQNLQAIYTGQAPINEAAQQHLGASAAADAAMVATQALSLKATELQKEAISTLANHTKELMQNSNTRYQQELGEGNTRIALEHAKRSWAAFAAKAEDNIDSYTSIVNAGRKFYSLPELTADQIKTLRNNPVNKQVLDTLGFTGASLVGASADPSQPMPNAVGSPGEFTVMRELTRGAPIQGTERIADLMDGYMATMPANMSGKAYTPAQKSEYLNSKFTAYKAGIVDVDADPIFGQPNIQDVASMARLNTPELVPFTNKVLKPLAASGQYMPMAAVVDAAVKSGLDPVLVNLGIGEYAKAAKEYVAVTRKHYAIGAEAPRGYKARVQSALGLTKTTVDFTDEKARTDYLFKRGMAAQGFTAANLGYNIKQVIPLLGEK
jgi:hypothetical protein